MAQPRKHRGIVERIVIQGQLRLETPAHFGNGDADAFTDMPLLRDEADGSALLLGTSLAGALRNYLREWEAGFDQPLPSPRDGGRFHKLAEAERRRLSTLLFGGFRGDEAGFQSSLIVADALGETPGLELRDGVKIDGKTRTAEDRKKYDLQLFQAGSTFDLRFELLLVDPAVNSAAPDPAALKQALAIALDGLARGDITLGRRKRRGYGQVSVSQWQVSQFRLTDADDLLAWLAEDHPGWAPRRPPATSASIYEALGVAEQAGDGAREYFDIQASFAIDGSLLIRAVDLDTARDAPDMVHLQSFRPDGGSGRKAQPVLPGTSVAGALRGRAGLIVRTLGADDERAADLINGMFGPDRVAAGHDAHASRLEIREAVLHGGRSLVQSRVKIDRFTGGAYESALFDEQPYFGTADSRVDIHLRLRLPKGAGTKSDAEVGLLLLLLKDLWTGDLTVGGEAGVGRGRLRGRSATLRHGQQTWTLNEAADGNLQFEGASPEALQAYVDALVGRLS